MPLPTSGELALSQIAAELGQPTPYYLRNMSEVAGLFGEPFSVSEFYGFSNAPEVIDVTFGYDYNSPYAVFAYAANGFPPFEPPVEVESNWGVYYYYARGRYYYTMTYRKTYTFSTPEDIYPNSYHYVYRGGDAIVMTFSTSTTSSDPRINIVTGGR